MIKFDATYFDGRSSKAHSVIVAVEEGRLVIAGGTLEKSAYTLEDCVITAPLGTAPRVIKLPGGGQIETANFSAVAALEEDRGENQGLRFVYVLENYWRTVAICFAGLIVGVWLFISHGIPLAAARLAAAVPPDLTENISRQTLELFDEKFLTASELDVKRKGEVEQMFRQVAMELDSGFNYRLELRKSDKSIGANAFALPAGIILVTDDLVNLAENDRQLIGVFAHEIGHVEQRHALRSIFQNAGVFLIVSALVGDIASITSTAATLPTMLAETGYSREFEKEADIVAGNYCIQQGWGTSPMIKMLQNLSQKEGEFPGTSLLSTHPLTKERVEYLKNLEKVQ